MFDSLSDNDLFSLVNWLTHEDSKARFKSWFPLITPWSTFHSL